MAREIVTVMHKLIAKGDAWYWRCLFFCFYHYLLLSCPHHIGLKSFPEQNGREKRIFTVFSWKKSAADMEDMNSSQPIPTGWIFKSEVQKDGSVYSYYYYPGTQQEFRTYEDLMRYVNYAMAAKLGPYSPVAKSISSQRRKNNPEDTVPTKLRKKAGSSRGRKRSSVPISKLKPLAFGNGSDTEEDPEMTVSDSSRTDTDDEDWYPKAADFQSME